MLRASTEGKKAMAEDVMDGVNAIVAEARKTKETAERMANGEGPPGEADDIRVLAGMVHQVAEQVERLASVVSGDEAPSLTKEIGRRARRRLNGSTPPAPIDGSFF
jgi:hypothetical protein